MTHRQEKLVGHELLLWYGSVQPAMGAVIRSESLDRIGRRRQAVRRVIICVPRATIAALLLR